MQSIAQGVGRPAQVQAGIAVQVQVGTAAHMQGQIAVAMTGMCFLDLRPAHEPIFVSTADKRIKMHKERVA